MSTSTVILRCKKCNTKLVYDRSHIDGDRQMVVCSSCGSQVGRYKDVLEVAKKQIKADITAKLKKAFK